MKRTELTLEGYLAPHSVVGGRVGVGGRKAAGLLPHAGRMLQRDLHCGRHPVPGKLPHLHR